MKIIQKLKELMKRAEEAYEKLMKELMTRPVSRGAAPAPAALAAGMFGGAAPARVAVSASTCCWWETEEDVQEHAKRSRVGYRRTHERLKEELKELDVAACIEQSEEEKGKELEDLRKADTKQLRKVTEILQAAMVAQRLHYNNDALNEELVHVAEAEEFFSVEENLHQACNKRACL